MKRCIIIVLIMSFMISVCGCQKNNSNDNYLEDNSNIVKLSSDIDFGDITYNIETDSQNYLNLSTRDIAVSADGYYFFKNAASVKKLMFIDRETKNCVPVCSSANCMHNNNECDAYFPLLMCYITYYEGELYTVLPESDANNNGFVSYNFYRISLDGSVCEKVFEMFYADIDSVVPQFIVHRGYVYYTAVANGEYCLYKRGLEEKKAQLLYSVSDENWRASLGGMRGYGDGILFAVKSGDSYDNKVIYYSQNTDKLYEVSDSAGSSWTFAVLKDGIVYSNGENIMKTTFIDLKTEILIEGVSGEVTYDGKYIYIDNLFLLRNISNADNIDYSERKIDVYDISGEYVDTIGLSGNSYSSSYGDEDYMFMTFVSGTISIFDKSQLGTDSHEWIEIDG